MKVKYLILPHYFYLRVVLKPLRHSWKAKPSVEPVSEDVDGASVVVFSTMSEKLFEGNFHEGIGPESCILIAGEDLVSIQSLASLRGGSKPSLLSDVFR